MEEMTTEQLDLYHLPIGVDGADESDDILFTKKAMDMIKSIRQDNNVPDEFFLRLGTEGGGCSGMKYNLGFDSELKENDREFELEGLKFVTTAKSLFHMMGITIDFTDGPQGSGFVFNSPNDLPSCGGCSAFH